MWQPFCSCLQSPSMIVLIPVDSLGAKSTLPTILHRYFTLLLEKQLTSLKITHTQSFLLLPSSTRWRIQKLESTYHHQIPEQPRPCCYQALERTLKWKEWIPNLPTYPVQPLHFFLSIHTFYVAVRLLSAHCFSFALPDTLMHSMIFLDSV